MAGFDELGGSLDVVGGDVVHGSPLVVRTPSTPVLDRLENRFELDERNVRSALPGLCHQRIAPGRGVSISPGSGSPDVMAPSTTIRWPDRYDASSEHIHRIGRAMSSGSAKRPSGMRSRNTFECTGSLMTNQERRGLMIPGAIALTRMPWRESSRAAVCITATWPDFEVL